MIVPAPLNGGLSINDIKFKKMDEKPFYRRPWFYIAGWLAFLLLMYGAQIYRMGGWRANLNVVNKSEALVWLVRKSLMPHPT